MGTDAVDAVLDRFSTAIASGDRATIAALDADDVQVWPCATNRVADRASDRLVEIVPPPAQAPARAPAT